MGIDLVVDRRRKPVVGVSCVSSFVVFEFGMRVFRACGLYKGG